VEGKADPTAKYQKLLTVRQVAEVLGVSQVTIRTWDRRGKIRTIRTPGNHRRIPEDELARLLNPEGQDVMSTETTSV